MHSHYLVQRHNRVVMNRRNRVLLQSLFDDTANFLFVALLLAVDLFFDEIASVFFNCLYIAFCCTNLLR
jgi:hypothetical protein